MLSVKQNVSTITKIFLATCESFVAVYISIIVAAHTYYRGNYVVYHVDWVYSSKGVIAGGIAALALCFTVFLLLLITID